MIHEADLLSFSYKLHGGASRSLLCFLGDCGRSQDVGFAMGIWSQQLSFGHSLNTADSQDFTLSIYGVVAWTAKIDSVASIDDLVFV